MKKCIKYVTGILLATILSVMCIVPAFAWDTVQLISLVPDKFYNELWVGDSVSFRLQVTGTSDDNATSIEYTVLEGADIVDVRIADKGLFTRAVLTFKKVGTCRIEFRVIDAGIEVHKVEKTFTVISAAPDEEVEIKVPSRLLLGQRTLSVGDTDAAIIKNARLECLYETNFRNVVDSGLVAAKHNIGGGPDMSRISNAYWGADIAIRPGTFDIDVSFDGNRLVKSAPVVIEEPIIVTSLPKQVEVGKTIDFTSDLENTALSCQKIDNFLSGPAYEEDSHGSLYHKISFRPKVEVVEGEELVESIDQDYSNTLSTSEKLKFIGDGTVKIKISYERITPDGQLCACLDTPYVVEKTVGLQVGKVKDNQGTDKTDQDTNPTQQNDNSGQLESGSNQNKGDSPQTGDSGFIPYAFAGTVGALVVLFVSYVKRYQLY